MEAPLQIYFIILTYKGRPVSILVRQIRQIADRVPELLNGTAVHEPGRDIVEVVRLEPRHRGTPKVECCELKFVNLLFPEVADLGASIKYVRIRGGEGTWKSK